jgi:uncharacterized membrane protein
MTSKPTRPRPGPSIASGPAGGDPAAGDPAAGDPAAGDPATGDPATGDPATGDPAAGDPATGEPATGEPVREADVTSASYAYLGAILSGPVIPLVVYLVGRRRSPFLRAHTAMALNLSLTGILYGLCCLILCGLLLLDSVTVALGVAIPVAVVIWLCMLRYLIRGFAAANRGERPETPPSWIHGQMVK